jgi:hypothetical protein
MISSNKRVSVKVNVSSSTDKYIFMPSRIQVQSSDSLTFARFKFRESIPSLLEKGKRKGKKKQQITVTNYLEVNLNFVSVNTKEL